MRSSDGAGELGFRDFPGLWAEKENRTGIGLTLPIHLMDSHAPLHCDRRLRRSWADLLVGRADAAETALGHLNQNLTFSCRWRDACVAALH
jgi:hypothetical protein